MAEEQKPVEVPQEETPVTTTETTAVAPVETTTEETALAGTRPLQTIFSFLPSHFDLQIFF